MSASKQAAKRLGKEYQAFQKEPPPFVFARPSEANILEWHFILRGPGDTEYAGGEYYGVIVFPADYPFKPPSMKMVTPSGRFQPNTSICTSMSNFHPGSWNPAWSCSTILTGLLSFMLAQEMTTGSITSTLDQKLSFAKASHAWNLTHPKFRSMFPEYSQREMIDLPDMGPPMKSISATAAAVQSNLSHLLATTPNSTTGLVEPPFIPIAIVERERGSRVWKFLKNGLICSFTFLILSFVATLYFDL